MNEDDNSAWTYVPEFQTVKCRGRYYLGPFATEGSISATLDTSAAHNSIVIMFYAVFIDAWDYEAFTILADDHVVFSERSSGKRAAYDTCLNAWTDAYTNFTFGFNHTAPTLNLVISSQLEKDVDTASWGICNFSVTAHPNYTDQYGNLIGIGAGNTVQSLTFSCSAPAMDGAWIYNPYYQAQSCAGSTYVYFGGGGSLSTQLSITEEHKGIIISFYLAYMDSWDGETFYVMADGAVVYSTTNIYVDDASNTCQNGFYDAYLTPTFGFNHTGNMLSLVFTSTLGSPSDDEAWGVCSIAITVVDYYVDASGTALDVDTSSLNTISSLYFSCSSPANDDTWTYAPAYTTITCDNGNTYVGGYGKEGYISSTFYIGEAHNGIIVSLKLALIDSWDGEAFTVTADGTVVYSLTHADYDSAKNICQNSWADSTSTITFGFNHSSASLTLTFSSTLDQVSTDEAWGICDLQITPSTYYISSNGYTVGTGAGGAVKELTFECSSPAVDTDWSYYPYYQVVECSGDTYVGGFGTGGYVASLLEVSETHLALIVSFKLAYLDSWDGSAFIVTADGKPVYITTYASGDSTSDSCQGDANDAFTDVKIGFNHTGPYVYLKFSSMLTGSADEQSWGICDLSITTSTSYVDSEGNEL